MKAYKAWDNESWENCSTIVFANNVKEAKKIAFHSDLFEGAEYIDIRVRRYKDADKLYKCISEIDWDDMDTRLALVRDLDWACSDISWECDTCPAKEFCKQWKDDEDDFVEETK